MALYRSRFDQYISECNELIIRHFGYEKMNDYAIQYEGDKNMDEISELDGREYRDQKITMRRFIKINFS